MIHLHLTERGLALAPLAAGLAATSVGALAARALGRTAAARALAGAATLGVAVLVGAHLLPECAEVIGPVAIALALASAAAPGLAGAALRARASHRDDAGPSRGAPLTALALGVHALADGFALALPAAAPGVVLGALLPALILHRVPEGAARWWLLGSLGARRRALALAALGAATLTGFALGLRVASGAGDAAMAALQSLAAGLLLHVLAHRSVTLRRLARRAARRVREALSPAARPGVTLPR